MSLADSLIERLAAHSSLLAEIDERRASLSGRASSPDESVCAEVDGLGAMTGLWLKPPALELDPDALAKLVVETAAAAARAAIERESSLYDELNERIRELREAPLTLWDGTTIKAPLGDCSSLDQGADTSSWRTNVTYDTVCTNTDTPCTTTTECGYPWHKCS